MRRHRFCQSRPHPCVALFLAFALKGETALGFTQLYPLFSSVPARRAWVLNDLFVVPGGAALLEEGCRFAEETGTKRLMLATAVGNLPAQRLYERLGWEREERFLHYRLEV